MVRAAAHVLLGDLAVAIAVEAHDHRIERSHELLDRDAGVTILVELLEAVDHTRVHRVQPQRLIFLEGQAAIVVLVERGQAVLADLVDLNLGDGAVLIGVELHHHALEMPATARPASVMAAAMVAVTALAVGQAGARQGRGAQGWRRQ